MSLSVGLIGLPNVGKSTLFNALTQAGAEASNYPFCTIDRNVGVAEVPDRRLEELRRLLRPAECLPATLQVVDVAGLVEGAHRGEGLGNRFLAHVRETDALVHVVRCFADPAVTHVQGAIDPLRDAGIVELELTLADLETAERALEGVRKRARTEPKLYAGREKLLERLKGHLEGGRPLREAPLGAEERAELRSFGFLTQKPILYCANVGENELGSGGGPLAERLRQAAGRAGMLAVSARLEAELLELPAEEREEWRRTLGLEGSGVERLAAACHRLLDLVTFYTTAHDKLRAWSLSRGTTAPAAAGRIHSDMEEGFIRAEVVAYEALAAAGSLARLHAEGRVRIEGRDYAVADGDVIHFLFRPKSGG